MALETAGERHLFGQPGNVPSAGSDDISDLPHVIRGQSLRHTSGSGPIGAGFPAAAMRLLGRLGY